MRGVRRQQDRERLEQRLGGDAVPQRIDVLHHRRDSGVVGERLRVVRDTLNRAVHHAHEIRGFGLGGRGLVPHHLPHQVPHLVQEPPNARDARIPEIATLLVGAEEHQVHAEGVGSPAVDVGIRVHDVAARLRHLRAVPDDHAVGAEAPERLLERHQSDVVQGHRDEARVHQVQDRVLVAADVRRDGEPLAGQLRIERHVVPVRRGIAQEVPCGVEERVGDVGLAPARLAARGARDAVPCSRPRQRRDPGVVWPEIVEGGEDHRQILLGHRHRAAVVAVDDRNRRPPVALPRDAPIMQPVVDDRLGETFGRKRLGDGALGLLPRHSVETGAVDHPPVRDVGLGCGERGERVLLRARDDAHAWELHRLGEFEVALVVAGHRHDRARAVLHQDVVGDPDRHGIAGGWIARVGAGEDAGLGLVADLAGDQVHRRHPAPIGVHVGALLRGGQVGHQGVLRRQHEVGRAEDRVRTRREHRDSLTGGRLEDQLGAVGASDPVGLNRPGRVRPVGCLQVIEQPLGILTDGEKPLVQHPRLDLHVRMPLAEAVDHLLVGEHGLARRAPVHGGAALDGQPGAIELEEDPLRPFVVARIGGLHLIAPIRHQPDPLELAAEPLDVARNQLGRMRSDLQGEVLRVDAERVEAQGLEDVGAAQPPVAALNIGAHERKDVPDVQPFGRRIRKHHQVEIRLRGAGEVGVVGAALLPPFLPPALDALRVVRDGFRTGHNGVR